MARKETITKNQISEKAFEMTRKMGFENVTARKVATSVGCSTQPIFRVYKNMEELWDAVYENAVIFFQEYYALFEGGGQTPFENMGRAYISFAKEESHLFRLLFVTARSKKKEMYEILNGDRGNVVAEIAKAKESGCPNPGEMFMKMWIFIHGAACMTLTGDYDLNDQETGEMLKAAYNSFSK